MSLSNSLRPRDLAILRALADRDRIAPGNLWHVAFPDEPYRSRRDAGMTRTLDRLQRLGFAIGRYEWGGTGRYWSITEAGRAAIK